MPATITHSFFAKDVYDILPEDFTNKIDLDRLNSALSTFEYTSLNGDMLDIKIYTKVDNVTAIIRIEFIEELNYPLMYVEDITED